MILSVLDTFFRVQQLMTSKNFSFDQQKLPSILLYFLPKQLLFRDSKLILF